MIENPKIGQKFGSWNHGDSVSTVQKLQHLARQRFQSEILRNIRMQT